MIIFSNHTSKRQKILSSSSPNIVLKQVYVLFVESWHLQEKNSASHHAMSSASTSDQQPGSLKLRSPSP